MSAAFAPDEATVAAYLGNQLPEPQAQAFEIYCLEHPEFARKVELDLCFRRGLREIGIRDGAPPKARPRMRWALAAGLAAAVALGVGLYATFPRPGALVAYSDLREVPPLLRQGVQFDVTLVRLRGTDAVHQVSAPRGSRLLNLKLLPDSAPGPSGYSVTIEAQTHLGSRPLILNGLRPDAEGFLELYLPLAQVSGHRLKISLVSDPDRALATAPAFALQVVAPPH